MQRPRPILSDSRLAALAASLHKDFVERGIDYRIIGNYAQRLYKHNEIVHDLDVLVADNSWSALCNYLWDKYAIYLHEHSSKVTYHIDGTPVDFIRCFPGFDMQPPNVSFGFHLISLPALVELHFWQILLHDDRDVTLMSLYKIEGLIEALKLDKSFNLRPEFKPSFDKLVEQLKEERYPWEDDEDDEDEEEELDLPPYRDEVIEKELRHNCRDLLGDFR